MVQVSEEFARRFNRLPKVVRERLAFIAASSLDESASGEDHEQLLADWLGEGFPGSDTERIDYGWVLEHMVSVSACEWVIEHEPTSD